MVTTTSGISPPYDQRAVINPAVINPAVGDDVGRDPKTNALTDRQMQILDLLATGASSKQVARALGLSVRTIDKHLEMAYRTLGVATRIQALRVLSAPEQDWS
jgi:DNA-binding NarL/FixJ family response regulator